MPLPWRTRLITTKFPPNTQKLCLKHQALRVGLPEGATGSSEVGHLNIGAGRIIKTEVSKISQAIQSSKFFENKVLLEALKKAKANNSSLHLIGLLSDGEIHSSQNHLFALLSMAKKIGLERCFCSRDFRRARCDAADGGYLR